MNNLFNKITLICLIIILLSIPNFANAKEISNNEKFINPRFSYINFFQNHFDISDSGKASISLKLNARDVDKVKVLAKLQQYKNGDWETFKTWSAKNNKNSVGLGKNYYISSGYLYRLKCYSYVYVNNRLVEMDKITSSNIWY